MEECQEDDDVEMTEPHALKRRGLVVAAVAAAAAIVIDKRPAAADDPDDVLLGGINNTTNDTTINHSGGPSATGLSVNCTAGGDNRGIDARGTLYGVYGEMTGGSGGAGVRGDTSSSLSSGVSGVSRSLTGSTSGVIGSNKSPDGAGVYGFGSRVGVIGSTDGPFGVTAHPGPMGVYGECPEPSGIGGVFTGVAAPLRLIPSSKPGAPSSGDHGIGELVVSSDGLLYFCAAGGTPGTWIELKAQVPAPEPPPAPAPKLTLIVLSTPERFVDTRSKLGGVQGPVAQGTTNTFSMTGRDGQTGNAALQVPDAATSIVGNLTVIGAEGVLLGSFVTLWPQGPQPAVSNINFGPKSVTGAVANSFVVGLSDPSGGHRGINVFNQSACDYVLDVSGYYILA